MRLIDADALLNKICKQFDIPDDWDGDIAEPLQTLIDIVDNFDVAYDVEAVVAELEELKGCRCGCLGVSCDKCKYKESCIEGEEAYKVTLDSAISIVRGKE